MQYTKDDGADNRPAQDTTVMNKAGRKDKKPSWVMFGITKRVTGPTSGSRHQPQFILRDM